MTRRNEHTDDRSPPRKNSIGLVLGIIFGILILCGGGGVIGIIYVFKSAVGKVGSSAERLHSSQNLQQIGLAATQYADVNKAFPTDSYSAEGKPLLSWRVHLLPYLEQESLCKQFRLDEPWDGENNRRLISDMPKVYALPPQTDRKYLMANSTYYRGFSHPGSLFARPATRPLDPLVVRGVRPDSIKDGMSQTILVVEAGEPIEWTKPEDLDASPGKPLPPLGGWRRDKETVLVLFADGSVKAVRKAASESNWRAATTYAGGEASASLDGE